MDIVLTYVIKALLLPQTSLFLLALIGTLLLNRGRKTGFYLLLTALLAWYLLSMPVTAKLLAKSLETYPVLQSSELSGFHPQAIVVLGGGLRRYAPEFGNAETVNDVTLERLRYAARLAKLTQLPILVSGGNVFGRDELPESEAMADTLEKDFSLKAHWQENQSHNTAENARFSYALLNQQAISRIILVTHALHMPRAAEEFKNSGFTLLPAPTGFLGDNLPEDILDFLPSAIACARNAAAIHEYLGHLWMQIKHPFK